MSMDENIAGYVVEYSFYDSGNMLMFNYRTFGVSEYGSAVRFAKRLFRSGKYLSVEFYSKNIIRGWWND